MSSLSLSGISGQNWYSFGAAITPVNILIAVTADPYNRIQHIPGPVDRVMHAGWYGFGVQAAENPFGHDFIIWWKYLEHIAEDPPLPFNVMDTSKWLVTSFAGGVTADVTIYY